MTTKKIIFFINDDFNIDNDFDNMNVDINDDFDEMNMKDFSKYDFEKNKFK